MKLTEREELFYKTKKEENFISQSEWLIGHVQGTRKQILKTQNRSRKNGVRDKWDNIPWKRPVARDFGWFLE